jgi:hypothetical protein
MEVSVCIAPYRAVLGNTMLSVKLQLSHGFLYKHLIEKGTVTHTDGAIHGSIEHTLSFIIVHRS